VFPVHMPQTRDASPLPHRVEEPVQAVPLFDALVVSVYSCWPHAVQVLVAAVVIRASVQH
jgi:hypothetical protein